MRIGTYNLKFLFDEGVRLHSGKKHNFTTEFVAKRFSYFAKRFDVMDTDILFVQELGDESALQKILKQTKKSYSYFVAKPDKYGVGNAVIFKKSIKCKCESISTNTALPTFSEKDRDVLGKRIWSRRDYVRLITKYKRKPITLIGVHVKSNFMMYEEGASFPKSKKELTQIDAVDATIRSEMFRLSQAKKIRELIDHAFKKNKNAYVISLGDFNALKKSKMFEMVVGRIKDRDDRLIHVAESKAIDHIVISKALKKHMSGIKVYNKSIGPDHPDSIKSDHAAVIIDLKI